MLIFCYSTFYLHTTIIQVSKQSEFKFEYESGDKTEEVIINVKENFTELSAKDVTVFNHFRKVGAHLRTVCKHEHMDMLTCKQVS